LINQINKEVLYVKIKRIIRKKHPYYCSDSNYYSNEASSNFESMTDFLDSFEDCDVDMNLVFRWDIRKNDDDDMYYAEIFMMLQRKGIFKPIMIDSVLESEVERFEKYLMKHKKVLNMLWSL